MTRVTFSASTDDVPVLAVVATGVGASADVSVFTASLKPRIAVPRSPPTVRSFFVQNTSETINATISQCQMLSEPMMFP